MSVHEWKPGEFRRRSRELQALEGDGLDSILKVGYYVCAPVLALTIVESICWLGHLTPLGKTVPWGPLWLVYSPYIFVPLVGTMFLVPKEKMAKQEWLALLVGVLISFLVCNYLPLCWKWPGLSLLPTNSISYSLWPLVLLFVAWIATYRRWNLFQPLPNASLMLGISVFASISLVLATSSVIEPRSGMGRILLVFVFLLILGIVHLIQMKQDVLK